jgi:hypothetical protein
LQALAGLGATLSGAAVAVFDPEPITKVGGAAFAAISADYYVTGMNTMIFGKPAMTATATALSGVAQDAGMDPQTADNLARGTNDAIVGLGGLKASMVASEAMAARLAAVAPKGLPATTEASVADKLERYLLNPDHPVGGPKANWFQQALGFTKENAADLATQIKFNEAAATVTGVTEHGTKFNQVITIIGANGKSIDVTFAWIRNNDGVVRLVTSIPTPR